MASDKICKTVRQYSKEPISPEDMTKLQEIAQDCCKVKNYVYDRFGGIGGLKKIYPRYTVQNEMTATDLRKRMGLPSVYFYLAIFDALADIKAQWNQTKAKVLQLVGENESLTPEEKHYLRFLLKVSNAFTAVLGQEPVKLPQEIQKTYGELAAQVDTGKLHRYLCRQVRKHHGKQHTDTATGFSVSERAYRYGDHGIYLSTKENRRRVFVPLTDNNQYKSQLYVKLYPEEGRIEIMAPVYVSVRSYREYTGCIGISMGMFTMVTTSDGHFYGKEFGEYASRYAEWVQGQTASYNNNRGENPGRKKYQEKKRCLEEQLHGYINHELNRFLKEEKPGTIYMVKLPRPKKGGGIPRINNQVSMWQRGYIRSRLTQKCKEQSIELIEVLGKDISRECSSCGEVMEQKGAVFTCGVCGYTADKKVNAARNIVKRGLEGKIVK